MKKLTRLVYASRISPQIKPDLPAVVREVLRVSRANNRQVGVTGMLLTYAGFFVQALEGEDERVQATLHRVDGDPRHCEVKVLGSEFVTARAFGRWAMCANNLSAADDDILRVLQTRGAFDPYAMTAASALKLLRTIADIHSRQMEAA
jgi:hypothetical protein